MGRKIYASALVSSVALSAMLASPAVAQVTPAGTAQGATSDNRRSADAQDGAEQPGSQSSEAYPDASQGIVVTGIRKSLEASRDLKRNATQFVDAIVADDIGKLPDRNVAESLARVSGIQVDRGIGEGTSISVRGLRQNVFLFNGREILDATGRGGNGIDTLQSSTYGLLSLVPSELISRLEVTKLAGANEIAGALGGIVNIQTRMPLDGPTQVAARAGATYDDLPQKLGAEVFGLGSYRSPDETFGFLISGSFSRRSLSQQGLDTFSGYSRYTDAGGTVRYGNSDVRAQDIQETRTRWGLDAAVQWRPAPGIDLTADTFYSKLTSDRSRYWLSFNPTAGLSNATYSSNNILLSGRARTPVLTNTEFVDTRADVWSSALRGKFEVAPRLHGTAEISYNRSTGRTHQIYWRMQPISSITPTVDFDFTNGDFGSYNISGVDLSDPSQLRYTILFDNTTIVASKATAARSDWTYDVGEGFLRAISFGGRYNRLNSTQRQLRADIRPSGGIPATQLSSYLTTYSNPDFVSGGFAGLPRSYLAASNAVSSCGAFTDVPAISQNAQCLAPTQNTAAFAGTYEIKERFIEGYGKADFGADMGNAELSGNVGVRYVDRELTSIGNLISPSGQPSPSTVGRTDREWLPSGVAKISLGNWTFRVGAARVVAFPNTADLNNGLQLFNNAVFQNGVQITPGTGNGGAPNLNPFKANQIDGSVEWYFSKTGMLSIGAFYKDVSTFIIQQQSAESYGGVDYLINRKVNGDGAKVKGIELLAQIPFETFADALSGFGVLATYSYIDSTTPIRDVAGRNLPFPGLSKNNINIVGYYEKDKFSFRLAYNWRDDYLVSLSSASTGIYNSPYTDLSATLRYDLTRNISVNVEMNNILDERQRTYDGSKEGLRTNVFFGRLYRANIAVKF